MQVRISGWVAALLVLAAVSGSRAQHTETTPIASVVGRYAAQERAAAGVYASDLGWTFQHEGRLWVLFGDTWRGDTDVTRNMGSLVADDAVGFISLANDAFPSGQAVEAFVAAHPAASGPAWRATSPTLTFAARGNLAGPVQPVLDGLELPSMPAQTPVAGFSNARAGDASGAFAIFLQNEKLLCNSDSDCNGSYSCDRGIGICIEEGQDNPAVIAQPCVIGAAPRPPFCARCDKPFFHEGMCVDTGSSVYAADSNEGRSAAVARIQQVGNARKDDPLRFDSQKWITQRFFNPASRTVSDFDERRAHGEGNDYHPADGRDPEREVVFLWGRPNFGGVGAVGRDARLYFGYVALPDYRRDGHFAWQPRFFTGVGADGVPQFSSSERDARALDLDAAQSGDQPEERNDMVGQTSVAWLPGLQRWVMLYGGGMGTAFGELIFGEDRARLDESTVGPIYIRYAEQPWGPWTAPEVLLAPGDPDVPSGQYAPGGILFSPRCQGATCAEPQAAWPTDLGGLYGPDIIEPWITTSAAAGGETTLYWHVSTWNPYQVVLMRTRITP